MESKLIVGEYQITKCYENQEQDTIWRIQEIKNTFSEFIINLSHNGKMYIKYFPSCEITFNKRARLLRTLCEHLSEQGYTLQISVVDTNENLKRLCLASGFKYDGHGFYEKRYHGRMVNRYYTIYKFYNK